MIVLLPPSETKRDGGDFGPIDLESLRFPQLLGQRRASVAALKRLSRSVADSTKALGLGATQRFEIDRNRAFSTAPTMPAMDRFTGVLYEALGAPALAGDAREWLARSVVIHSALLGPVGAGDLVPAYRFSADSRLAGFQVKKHWADATAAALAKLSGPILDMRSESYAALGPVSPAEQTRYVRVVTEADDGKRRALNHFNKKGKGEFVRALALAGIDHNSIDSVFAWARASGFRLEESSTTGELDLVV